MPEQMSFFDQPPARDTLQEARDKVRDGLEDCVECPCCKQLCKLYARNMNSARARALIWLVNKHELALLRRSPHSIAHGQTCWTHIRTEAPKWLIALGGEFAKLRYWGFITERPNDDKRKRTSGYWKPTQAGRDFAHGRAMAIKTFYVFDGEVQRASTELISVRAALGEQFDYQELMNGKDSV